MNVPDETRRRPTDIHTRTPHALRRNQARISRLPFRPSMGDSIRSANSSPNCCAHATKMCIRDREMRSRGKPGAANKRDHITALHSLPFFHQRLGKVSIDRLNPISMVQLNHIAHFLSLIHI